MKVDRKAFVEVLENLKPALSSGGAIPELKHFWFDGKYAYAYDGGLGVRLPLESDLKGGILGTALLGLVNSSMLKEIFLDVVKGELVIQIGKSKVTLPVLDVESNPWPFPVKANTQDVELKLTQEFIDAIKFVRVLKADNPKRADHYGVVLFPSRDIIGLYTTDSQSIASVEVKGKYARELDKIVLPHSFAAQLVSLGKVEHQVYFSSDFIMAELVEAQVCSNLLDSTDVYDIPSVVDKYVTGKEKYVDTPVLLQETLARASILAGPKENYIKLSINKKELQVTGKLALGALQEKLTLVQDGGSGEITVELSKIKSFSKATSSFAISKEALILLGEGTELFVVAAHEEK